MANSAGAVRNAAPTVTYRVDLDKEVVWVKIQPKNEDVELARLIKESAEKTLIKAYPHQSKHWSHFVFYSEGPPNDGLNKVVACLNKYGAKEHVPVSQSPAVRMKTDKAAGKMFFHFTPKKAAEDFAKKIQDVGLSLVEEQSGEWTHSCLYNAGSAPDGRWALCERISQLVQGPKDDSKEV